MAVPLLKAARVLALNGSPRGDHGATDIVVRRFLGGASSAGADTDILYPALMDISPCDGCFDCWFKTPRECHFQDDMASIIERFIAADLLVFASPLYMGNMTAQMKVMFDRLISTVEPFIEYDGGRAYHPEYPPGKRFKVAVISVGGFPERHNFQTISLVFRELIREMRAELLGEFFFPASFLLVGSPDRVEKQLEAVEKAGREAVTAGTISRETIEAANREYVEDPRRLVDYVNEMFRSLRKHHGIE